METHTKLCSFDNYVLANITLGLLQTNNIDCYLEDEHVATLGTAGSNAVGGIKLFVKTEEYNEAVVIVNNAENEYLKEIKCTVCKSKGLETEHKIKKPTNFWETIKNKILYGQSIIYSKKYRCLTCKSLFNQIPISLNDE